MVSFDKMSSTRSVSFVERLELEFQGNLAPGALALGDIDNDNDYELVVGNVNGHVFFYKGQQQKAWKTCEGLGLIVCVGIGDICNRGLNNVVVVSDAGWCYIFDISPQADISEEHILGTTIEPIFRQLLAVNIKVIMIADIDGDGQFELVVGFTDRFVRAYKWQMKSEPFSGKLVQNHRWHLTGQISSLTMLYPEEGGGLAKLTVSQPGCNYATLSIKTDDNKISSPQHKPEDNGVVHYPVSKWHTRNPDISSDIIGNISRGKTDSGSVSSMYAMSSLDGTIMLMNGNRNVWSLQIHQQLFSLHKLDITGEGEEEVIACAWDGQTYIYDHSQCVVKFKFEEHVCAFTAGFYTVETNVSRCPCLVYVTFNNRIILYFGVKLPHIATRSFIDVMEMDPEFEQLIQQTGIDPNDSRAKRALYRRLIYGSGLELDENR